MIKRELRTFEGIAEQGIAQGKDDDQLSTQQRFEALCSP